MKAKYSIVVFPIVGSVRICVVVDCFCMRWDILKSRNAACLIMPISQGYFHMTAVQFIWTESKCILYTRWSGFILITLFSTILGQTIKSLCIITWLGPQESGVCWTKKIALHGRVHTHSSSYFKCWIGKQRLGRHDERAAISLLTFIIKMTFIHSIVY